MAISTLNIAEGLDIVSSEGDKSSMSFAPSGDLILRNPARGPGGRALVPGGGGALEVNVGNDFTVVLVHGGMLLPDLDAPPAGVQTDRIVIGADGKLYKTA